MAHGTDHMITNEMRTIIQNIQNRYHGNLQNVKIQIIQTQCKPNYPNYFITVHNKQIIPYPQVIQTPYLMVTCKTREHKSFKHVQNKTNHSNYFTTAHTKHTIPYLRYPEQTTQ